MGGQHDLTWALFYGAGQYIAQKDADDNPYLTINSETALTVADKLSSIASAAIAFVAIFLLSLIVVVLLTKVLN